MSCQRHNIIESEHLHSLAVDGWSMNQQTKILLFEFVHTGAKWRNSNKTGDPGGFFLLHQEFKREKVMLGIIKLRGNSAF